MGGGRGFYEWILSIKILCYSIDYHFNTITSGATVRRIPKKVIVIITMYYMSHSYRN